MSLSSALVYDRILDATAISHMVVKIFTLVIVIRHTPPNMRYLSMFLLNGLLWNFGANLVFTVMHFYPTYPSECFRVGGILSELSSELFGHAMMLLLFVCIVNCAIALTATFCYRYLLFRFKLKPQRSIVFWSVMHLFATICTVFLYSCWTVPKARYPIQDELSSNELFCLDPHGVWKTAALSAFLGVVMSTVFFAFMFSFLLLRSIKEKKNVMHKKLLDRHRNILWTLITTASVPLLFAAMPLTVAIVTVFAPRLPYAREICVSCIVVIANHGTLYSFVLICAIQPYREAARRLLSKAICSQDGNISKVSKTMFLPRSL
ncbi:hypothetical protein QR680_016478 [Steinernema hermaphroditum]|uniref:Uncharacterized protein n=1 Tax=Steinernema hermaphroditum TaxID=289476 RepID=A0AA39HBP3_9BILA|nr:hypothetical protein QR680_016478 [Steinernema hermaphroditum]